jgi:ABC-type transport system substrate-binding protein
MPAEGTRRRFLCQALGVIRGTMVPRDQAKFPNANPLNARALKDSCAWLLANGGSGSSQLKVNGLPSADRIEEVDEVTLRLHLDRPVAWGLYGHALLGTSIVHAKEILKHTTQTILMGSSG